MTDNQIKLSQKFNLYTDSMKIGIRFTEEI